MRGNAQQLMEKYLAMARDASSAGDRVLAENYFQHADHYYRVLNARFEQQQQNNGNRHQNYNQNGGNNGQNYNQGGYDGDQQPNFNEQPQGQQPHHVQHQPQQYQPQYQQPPQYQQVQPEPAHEQPRAAQNEDIGLPPGILGMNPQQGTPQSDNRQQPQAREDGGEDRGRQGGRRRRGRGDRSGADAE